MRVSDHFLSYMNNGDTIQLAPGRLEHIVQILQERRIVRVQELCEETGASAATIRRDLLELEHRGQLQRVHGGAVTVESRLEEPVFDDKAGRAMKEKEQIARLALKYIEPGDCVFLDGGSTVLALARLVGERSDLTVVTNSLKVASSLATGGPRLILVGGEFRRRSLTFVGSLTGAILDQLHVDKAFMGTIGLTVREGLTTTDPREAHTKRLVIKHAGRVLLLADSSKVGKVSFIRFATLSEMDVLITDAGLPSEDLSVFRSKIREVVI